MATAAKMISGAPKGTETNATPAPGDPERFAALVADASSEGGAKSPDAESGNAEPGEAPAADLSLLDPATLLPMLDQQRAASPAATLVTSGEAAGAEKGAVVKGRFASVPAALSPVQGPIASEPGIATVASAGAGSTVEGSASPLPAQAFDRTAARPTVAGEAAFSAETKPNPTDTAVSAPASAARQAQALAVQGAIDPKAIAAVTDQAPTLQVVVRPQPAGEGQQQPLPAGSAPSSMAEVVGASQSAGFMPATSGTRRQAAAIVTVETAPAPKAEDVAGSTASPVQPEARPFGQPAQPFAQALSAAAAPAQNLGAALAAQVLDMTRGGEWIDQLARDISGAASKDGAMRFQLTPETLGELRVEITHSERGAHVRLHVTSEAAQQALADAQPKLTAEARAQGVRIAETEINFTNGQSQGREAGRQTQPQPQPEQTLRTPRTVSNNHANHVTDATEPAGRNRADRYA